MSLAWQLKASSVSMSRLGCLFGPNHDKYISQLGFCLS